MQPCAVEWCIALAKRDGRYCAIHGERGPSYRISDAPWSVACDDCGGSGECEDCEGAGSHDCEHANCYESHDCPTCRGSGECRACHPPPGKRRSFEERYLEFAFDAGRQPPVLVEWPWDAEALKLVLG